MKRRPSERRQLRILVALVAAAALPFGGAPAVTDAAVVPTITAVSAGSVHTCALTSGGGVKCWGQNGSGQLGNGSTTSSNVPVNVSGLASGVSAIAAGGAHGCALNSDGGVKCWGQDRSGQLGNDGWAVNSNVPVDVLSLASGIQAITAGESHTCALSALGGVKCWGDNDFGQLGNGIRTDSNIPVEVSGLASGVRALSAGYRHTCALTSSGGVKCWGSNFAGQLGNGTTTDSTTPVDVSGLASGVSAIAAGSFHTCTLVSSGGAKCWGNDDDYGQLGNGSLTTSRVPVEVAGLASAVATIDPGAFHACVLTSVGEVRCWGSNGYGQLGNGTTTDSTIPVHVPGLGSGVRALSAGYIHTCALTSGGGVKCWGSNVHGQLGNGTRTGSGVPVDVDFATYQTIALRASKAAGTIAPGTAVSFSAHVRPLGLVGERGTIRFEFFRKDNGVWRLAARRDVVADATGRATLRWTFATTGSRYIRARALANSAYGASGWSAKVIYTVG